MRLHRGMSVLGPKTLTTYADTIRLAIGLRTHHIFTPSQLLAATCQPTCLECSKAAALVDMTDLSCWCCECRDVEYAFGASI
jgi:hypothetical protein